jgi:3-oxoacid CoA-transferase subunit A
MNEKIWNDGIVYYESNYPKILYAKDGEIYNFGGKKVLVLGGAYSVDKYYRLAHGWQWFDDEQMSEEVKDRCIENIKANNWTVDIVLSHTVPYNYRPIDLFLSCIDQSTVDESMENWLQYIEDNLTYQKWYAGHYHCDRVVNKIELMFTTIKELII